MTEEQSRKLDEVVFALGKQIEAYYAHTDSYSEPVEYRTIDDVTAEIKRFGEIMHVADVVQISEKDGRTYMIRFHNR